MARYHTPCMPTEVARYLNCRPGQTIVDGTLGGGGHARMISSQIAPDGLLIGIDQDKDAIHHARKTLARFDSRVQLVHANFADLGGILDDLEIGPERRRALLGSYFGPKSDFRKGLIESLFQ